jgi:IMP dehydrogenase/GMP reductase
MEFNLKSKKELFADALTFDDVLLVPGYSNVLPGT